MRNASGESGQSGEGKGCLAVALLCLLFGVPGTVIGVLGLLGYPNPVEHWFDDGTSSQSMLFGGAIVTAMGFVGLLVGRSVRKQDSRWRRIRRQGLEGSARVTRCEPAGGSYNFQPRWTLDLDLEFPGRAPFSATRTQALPHDVASRLAGSTLKVRAAPEDLTEFVIVEGLGTLGDWRGL